jgi:hypothetical protein
MFYKCLTCGAVILDPDLNTWQCALCGSEDFVVADESASGPGTLNRSPRPAFGAAFACARPVLESRSLRLNP